MIKAMIYNTNAYKPLHHGQATPAENWPSDAQGKNKFSVLVDESTDVATVTHLGIVIRYCSESKTTIVTESYLHNTPTSLYLGIEDKARTLLSIYIGGMNGDVYV